MTCVNLNNKIQKNNKKISLYMYKFELRANVNFIQILEYYDKT